MMAGAKWVVYGVLFAIPFLVLYMASTMFFPFITGKGFIFRILIDAALVAYLILAAGDKRYRPQFSWTLILYTALTAWMLLADFLAINPHKAFWSNYERMDGWVTLAHVFAFFLIAGAVLTADKLWKKWWMAFIGASALVVAYSFIQLAGGAQIHQGGVRVDASFGNAAYLASYLLFALGATLWQAVANKGWLRYALIALALAQALVLFNTATRGAILGLVGAALFAALLYAIESGKKGRRTAGAALAIIALAIGGFFLVRETPLVTESPILSRIASITLAEGQTRFTLWGMAYEGVLERPLTGYGHEGFNYVFNERYVPSLYGQEAWFDRAHNVFIDWLVWGGFPAFFLLIGLLAVAALSLYRSDASRPERIFLLAALAAYAFQALFVFDHLFSYVPLAAILAMAHSASMRPMKRMEALPVPSQSKLETIAAPVGVVAALALAWVVNAPGMSGASHLVYAISPIPGGVPANTEHFRKAVASGTFATQEIAEQATNFYSRVAAEDSIPKRTKEELFSVAEAQVRKEVERAPADARLHLQYAILLRAGGNPEAALAASAEAIKLSPYKQGFYLERAEELLALDRTEEARALFRQAYEFDTQFTDLAAYAASADILAGDTEAAQELLQSAFGTTTVDHQALVRAYVEKKMYPELIAVLKLQVENQGGSPGSRMRLISGYVLAGRISDARREAHALLAAHPSESARVEQILKSLPN